jgi:hypothetical protein
MVLGALMTLNEFIALVKDNIDLFVQDYYEKREKEPRPDLSYPLESTREKWFSEFETWILTKEAHEYFAKKQQSEEPSNVEFNLDTFE